MATAVPVTTGILSYLHLRENGNVSLAVRDRDNSQHVVEYLLSPADQPKLFERYYATLLAAYITQTEIQVRPTSDQTNGVKQLLFGHDPS